jgi:replicative DNA helicase
MLTPEIAERNILNSIENNESYVLCKERGVDKDTFFVYKEEWEFIDEYQKKYKRVPSKEIIKTQFPKFKIDAPLPINPCIDEIIEHRTQRNLVKFLNDNASIAQQSPKDFLQKALKEFSKLNREQTYNSYSVFDNNAADTRIERLKLKQEAKKKQGLLGIPTGLETLDREMYGWQPGRLIGIIARLGMGKSWLLSYFALAAHRAGKKVLFISPEMTKEEVEDRFDTLYARMLFGWSIKNSALSSGGFVDIDKYQKYLEVLEKGGGDRLHIYDSALGKPFSTDIIADYVDRHKPDILCIDGVYLISSSNGGDATDWRSFADISRGLKNIAMDHKIAVLGTSQANRDAGKDDKKKNDLSVHPTIEQIGYGDSLAQYADYIFSLAFPYNDEERKVKRTLKMLKARGAALYSDLIELHFEVNEGRIGEVTDPKPSAYDEDDEEE